MNEQLPQVRQRGRTWTVEQTHDPHHPFALVSGTQRVSLVHLPGSPEGELTPMVGTRQMTSRFGLFRVQDGSVVGLD